MITRRTLISNGAASLLAATIIHAARAAPPAANDPLAIVNAIYVRAAKSKGDAGSRFSVRPWPRLQ